MTLQYLLAKIPPGKGYTTEFKLSCPSNLVQEICTFADATDEVLVIGLPDIQRPFVWKNALAAVIAPFDPNGHGGRCGLGGAGGEYV
jgi:hypothetical protein